MSEKKLVCDRGEIGELHLAAEELKIQAMMRHIEQTMPHELLPHQKHFVEHVLRQGGIQLVNTPR